MSAAPACAEGNRPAPCDHYTLEAFPRTAHWRTFEGRFDHRSEGLFLSCGKVLKRSGSLQILGGLSVMSFINSYQHQSYGLGASLEVQYRPPALGNIGAYAGIDAGIIHGYAGFFPEKYMLGTLTPAAQLKLGLLYDLPGTPLTLTVGLRAVPPLADLPGTLSPSLGVTQRF